MVEIELKRRAVYVSDVHTALLKAGCDLDEALDILTSIPTADVAPVVRCQDCKHYAMWADGRTMNHCDYHDRLAYDDDFCSCGARMDGGADNGE